MSNSESKMSRPKKKLHSKRTHVLCPFGTKGTIGDLVDILSQIALSQITLSQIAYCNNIIAHF